MVEKELITIRFSGEDAKLLKQKASELKISPTAYIRRLIRSGNCPVIKMGMDDIDDFIRKFTNLERAFAAAVGFIERSDGVVFSQDIELLKDYMKEMTELFTKQVEISYRTRLSAKRTIVKEAMEQIKNRIVQ
ncbi:MAG: hypothetical protein IKS48_02100 [Eubacterium sp.]|nr:hypothetical protein [Eubacterium sp.]